MRSSVKIKARRALTNNDRISVGGRVFVFNDATGGACGSKCVQEQSNKEALVHSDSSVELVKKEFYGQLSLMKTNGTMGAVVKIRGEIIIGRYVYACQVHIYL
jgi:hypothetical protein